MLIFVCMVHAAINPWTKKITCIEIVTPDPHSYILLPNQTRTLNWLRLKQNFWTMTARWSQLLPAEMYCDYKLSHYLEIYIKYVFQTFSESF